MARLRQLWARYTIQEAHLEKATRVRVVSAQIFRTHVHALGCTA